MSDPTLEELNAVIAQYPDPNDKLTIALGNFNRVRAERDHGRALLREVTAAWLRFDQSALDELLAPFIDDAMPGAAESLNSAENTP